MINKDFSRPFYSQVIQRRGDFGEPKENFTREWDDYKHGFGDLNGEFWFGNDYIHQLTQSHRMRLRVELESHYGQSAWAEYDNFRSGTKRNILSYDIV